MSQRSFAQRLAARVTRMAQRWLPPEAAPAASAAAPQFAPQALENYVQGLPSDQQALDIFSGSWSSAMPPERSDLHAGQAQLFEDARIPWMTSVLGSLSGQRILELGPLEGGHSYMMERAGAASVLSIEANTQAYLKCLVVKEVLGLARCHFMLGDFLEYLKTTGETFDLCVASGVLYHMENPVELIGLLGKVSARVMIWTHYYDREVIQGNPELAHKFEDGQAAEWQGFRHTLYRQNYKAALGWSGFCGGSLPYSNWLTLDDLMAALRHFGFSKIEQAFHHHATHPNGPAIALACTK